MMRPRTVDFGGSGVGETFDIIRELTTIALFAGIGGGGAESCIEAFCDKTKKPSSKPKKQAETLIVKI